MEDYKDFWVVVGTAMPLIALAQVVIVGTSDTPRSKHGRSRTLVGLISLAGMALSLIGFMFSLFVLGGQDLRVLTPTPFEGAMVSVIALVCVLTSTEMIAFGENRRAKRKRARKKQRKADRPANAVDVRALVVDEVRYVVGSET